MKTYGQNPSNRWGFARERGKSGYVVDPMSDHKYMPDAAPAGGMTGTPVRVTAALGEFEPASFVLTADEDLGKVDVRFTGDLRGKAGAFPAKEIDLRVVKVWYQNQNGWYGYFDDDTLKLCPELLLHDEDLVKVDETKKANYARLSRPGNKFVYQWISPPKQVSRVEDKRRHTRTDGAFQAMRPDFCDAPEFRGVTLEKGRYKQILLTVHVPKTAKPGVYRGEAAFIAKGRRVGAVPVELRVLPFELPPPGCVYDPDKNFRTTWCWSYDPMQMNGGDAALAKKQSEAVVRNLLDHNNVLVPDYFDKDLLEKLGVDRSLMGTGVDYGDSVAWMRYSARRSRDRVEREVGGPVKGDAGWGDEYDLGTLRRLRPGVRAVNEQGFGFNCNSHAGYSAGANVVTTWWPPIAPDQSSKNLADHVNALGGDVYLGWYAVQHVAAENPAFVRRQYGLGPYLAGLSQNANYELAYAGWNDLGDDTYRPMVMTYGSGNGCIDTLQWEGFREGLDDIRYATLLKKLALPLAKKPLHEIGREMLDARYEAKLALKYLADLDADDFDLTTARLEMIRHVLRLLELGAKVETKDAAAPAAK